MGERVVVGRKGSWSMVKVRWTEKAPPNINDVSDAEEMERRGRARSSSATTSRVSWSNEYYESNDYMIDND